MQKALAKSSAIPAINGLRAVAIIGVIWHHSFANYFSSLGAETPWSYLRPVLGGGWLGVNLFFFLSGFVLYLPFVSGDQSFRNKQDLTGFYAKRARRLLPLFYFSLLVGFVFVKRDFSAEALNRLLLSCSLLYNFHPQTFFPDANWVLWSLGVELLFSLVFPLLVMAIERHSLTPVVFFSVIFALNLRLVGYSSFHPPVSDGYLNVVCDSIFGRIDDFVLGMFGAGLYAGRISLPPALRRAAGPVGVALIAGALAMFDQLLAGKIPLVFGAMASSLLNFGILSLFICIFQTRWLNHALSLRPLQVIGMMCYSLYVWHGLLLLSIYPHFVKDPLEVVRGLDKYPIFLVSLGLFAAFTYRYVEFPKVDARTLFLPGKSPMRTTPVVDDACTTPSRAPEARSPGVVEGGVVREAA